MKFTQPLLLFYSQGLFKNFCVLTQKTIMQLKTIIVQIPLMEHSLWGIKQFHSIWVNSSVKTDQGWCLGEVSKAEDEKRALRQHFQLYEPLSCKCTMTLQAQKCFLTTEIAFKDHVKQSRANGQGLWAQLLI